MTRIVMARIFSWPESCSWPECVAECFCDQNFMDTGHIFVARMFGQNFFVIKMFGQNFMETGHVVLWPEFFRGQNV